MQKLQKKNTHIVCTLLACILLATACTGPMVIGSIYNGASKRISKEMRDYAKFNNAQKKMIDSSFAQYHQWHRTTQLPLYSDFLRDIATQLDSEIKITPATVTQWIKQASEMSMAIRHCNPLNDSNKFWATLSDDQTRQIKQKTADVHTLRVQKYKSETATERSARRHKEILTWSKRAGLKFNSLQSDLLTNTLAQQISLGGQRLLVWQQWTDQFNNLLTTRNNDNFTIRMNNHVHKLWTLTQANYPNEWQTSTDLWTDFLHQFLALQTAKQNQRLQMKTSNMASTLDIISKDTVSSVAPRCFNPLR